MSVTLKHSVVITETHNEDGVSLDLVFEPSDADYSTGVTPGFLVGASIVKSFRNGDLERLVEKYLNEVQE